MVFSPLRTALLPLSLGRSRISALSSFVSLFPPLPSSPFPLSFSLLPVRSGRLSTSRREPRRYLHVSVARETKNYYLYALVGGGGFCSSQTKLAATTPWLGLEVPVVDRSRGWREGWMLVSGGVGGGEERWVPAHPPAPANLPLSTVSEIMCCGYTGVTALRPDVGGGLRTYVRAATLLFALSPRRSIYFSPLSLLSSSTVAPIVFSHECTLL